MYYCSNYRYAREDTHYLLYIYDLMKIKLFELPKEAESSDPPLLEVTLVNSTIFMPLDTSTGMHMWFMDPRTRMHMWFCEDIFYFWNSDGRVDGVVFLFSKWNFLLPTGLQAKLRYLYAVVWERTSDWKLLPLYIWVCIFLKFKPFYFSSLLHCILDLDLMVTFSWLLFYNL